MKALVVGAAGFVGRYLVNELHTRGHDVVGIDRNASPEIVSVDILDYDALRRYMAGSECDVVYHLAAGAFVHADDISDFYKINVMGTLNLLRCCGELERAPWFIYISSSLVYGSGDGVFTEESPLKTINHYAASKMAAEALVQAFTVDGGLTTLILRPFNHTGVGQSEMYLIPKLVKAFRDRHPVIPMGNMEVVRDFLDVRDVVRAYALVADSLDAVKPGEVFNIGSGRGYSIKGILDMLAETTGHHPRIEQVNRFTRRNDITHSVGNCSKFKQQFQWEPRYTLSETLRWMLEYMS